MDNVLYDLMIPPVDEVAEHYRRQWHMFRKLDRLEAEVRPMKVRLPENPRPPNRLSLTEYPPRGWNHPARVPPWRDCRARLRLKSMARPGPGNGTGRPRRDGLSMDC